MNYCLAHGSYCELKCPRCEPVPAMETPPTSKAEIPPPQKALTVTSASDKLKWHVSAMKAREDAIRFDMEALSNKLDATMKERMELENFIYRNFG